MWISHVFHTFVPARMQNVRLLGETFERPKDFDPQEHFRMAFGIFSLFKLFVVFHHSEALNEYLPEFSVKL